MRIVAGDYKGRTIAAPKTQATRPTSDRAREALFNVLTHADWAPPLPGTRVLDLFAGSGALGLEALSRGAAFCTFVETGAAARAAIRDNIERLDLFGRTRIHRRSATALGPCDATWTAPFDLAFLDPPYETNLVEPALARLVDGGWLTARGVAVAEVSSRETIAPPGWRVLDERTFGAARIYFLSRAVAD